LTKICENPIIVKQVQWTRCFMGRYFILDVPKLQKGSWTEHVRFHVLVHFVTVLEMHYFRLPSLCRSEILSDISGI